MSNQSITNNIKGHKKLSNLYPLSVHQKGQILYFKAGRLLTGFSIAGLYTTTRISSKKQSTKLKVHSRLLKTFFFPQETITEAPVYLEA